MIPYSFNTKALTFFFGGRPYTYALTNPIYQALVDALRAQDENAVNSLVNQKKIVSIATFGAVSIDDDDNVRFNGTVVPEYLANRIIEHYKSDPNSVTPLVAFATKLMANPDTDVRTDLYLWVEKGNMPVFEDGDFLAYKVVRGDFTPIHNGTQNAPQVPGATIEMNRSDCDNNRNNTCSRGLHFCSYEYLPSFVGFNSKNKVIALKINPADVVAIPTDYNLTKGRTCRFTVLNEIDPNTIKEDFGSKFVVATSTFNYYDPEDQDLDDEDDSFAAYIDDLQDDVVTQSAKTTVDKASRQQTANQALVDCNGNKTAAAKKLGLSRSTFYDWLKG